MDRGLGVFETNLYSFVRVRLLLLPELLVVGSEEDVLESDGMGRFAIESLIMLENSTRTSVTHLPRKPSFLGLPEAAAGLCSSAAAPSMGMGAAEGSTTGPGAPSTAAAVVEASGSTSVVAGAAAVSAAGSAAVLCDDD